MQLRGDDKDPMREEATQDITAMAEAISRRAHHGQMYGSRDYIDAHVAQVAAIVARLGYDETHIATAWLHDVLEDTDVTQHDLADKGIPPHVIAAVEALTERSGESHADYLSRVAQNEIAIAVKYADSSANFASTVLLSPYLTDEDFRDWSRRYAHAIAYLLPKMPRP
jgi:(p)ppGpp synthase/HD superfamily hydrolase